VYMQDRFMEDDKNKVPEVDFKQALEMVNGENKRLVWLGREPVDYIRGLLELNEKQMVSIDVREIMEGLYPNYNSLNGAVFVCYHGNTSRVITKYLKSNKKVDAYSLKGGVTALVGEIF
jgi:rhodanese-related sulfurtransferase